MNPIHRGDVVVMDNLPAHKVGRHQNAILAAGTSPPVLPPYSSDLEPIELDFAKLKALLRRAAVRTTLWSNLGQALSQLGTPINP